MILTLSQFSMVCSKNSETQKQEEKIENNSQQNINNQSMNFNQANTNNIQRFDNQQQVNGMNTLNGTNLNMQTNNMINQLQQIQTDTYGQNMRNNEQFAYNAQVQKLQNYNAQLQNNYINTRNSMAPRVNETQIVNSYYQDIDMSGLPFEYYPTSQSQIIAPSARNSVASKPSNNFSGFVNNMQDFIQFNKNEPVKDQLNENYIERLRSIYKSYRDLNFLPQSIEDKYKDLNTPISIISQVKQDQYIEIQKYEESLKGAEFIYLILQKNSQYKDKQDQLKLVTYIVLDILLQKIVSSLQVIFNNTDKKVKLTKTNEENISKQVLLIKKNIEKNQILMESMFVMEAENIKQNKKQEYLEFNKKYLEQTNKKIEETFKLVEVQASAIIQMASILPQIANKIESQTITNYQLENQQLNIKNQQIDQTVKQLQNENQQLNIKNQQIDQQLKKAQFDNQQLKDIIMQRDQTNQQLQEALEQYKNDNPNFRKIYENHQNLQNEYKKLEDVLNKVQLDNKSLQDNLFKNEQEKQKIQEALTKKELELLNLKK